MREKRARKAKATDPKQTNMEEKEGKRMVGVHRAAVWKEKEGKSTKGPQQATFQRDASFQTWLPT